jgi:multicomponent Na+:H+ antiporter subunit B
MTRQSEILDVVARALYPAMLCASVVILLRGHDNPGGGFIGGMIAVAATSFRAVATGSGRALRAYPGGAVRVAAGGVLLAAVSGMPALWSGAPYLTHHLSASSSLVSSVLLFDVGVYLAVWGALGGIAAHMIGLGEERQV